MGRPYDPALKTLAELAPEDWLPLAGRRPCRVTVEDGDVGTVIRGAADKLFRVHDDPEYLLHLDFESGHFRASLPARLRLYHSAFEYRHDRVVLSVCVLLRPEADSPQWSGLLERGLPGEAPLSTLRYGVVRVWQLDPARLLASGVGTLALAPISDVSAGEVRGVLRQVRERLSGPQAHPKAGDVLAASYFLLGLRYSDEFAQAIFDEVMGMEDSTTYQATIRKGATGGARRLLLRIGTRIIGPPQAEALARVEAINDLTLLEAMADRLLDVTSWDELLP